MKRLVLFSLLLVCVLGCAESGPATPADQFNNTQSDTNTPYGNVRDDSAVDNPDGTITFETDNGDRLTVPVQETEAGPRYGTPTRDAGR
jgi:hypothetical protein